MQPYDLCIVLANDDHYNHQVWAEDAECAVNAVVKFYSGTAILGVVLGTEG
jgi:hypothetical protein